MKNNKLYMPADALKRREDFDLWYEDGTHALTFRGAWSAESDKVAMFGRMGGENGHIKPDNKALSYYLRLERYEYAFHTIRLFEQYYVEGMKWDVFGSLEQAPFEFVNEETGQKGGRVRLIDFRDKGPCYEIMVKNVVDLRIAAMSVVSMAIKEEFKGKSEGLRDPNATRLQKVAQWLKPEKGITYEELKKERGW